MTNELTSTSEKAETDRRLLLVINCLPMTSITVRIARKRLSYVIRTPPSRGIKSASGALPWIESAAPLEYGEPLRGELTGGVLDQPQRRLTLPLDPSKALSFFVA